MTSELHALGSVKDLCGPSIGHTQRLEYPALVFNCNDGMRDDREQRVIRKITYSICVALPKAVKRPFKTPRSPTNSFVWTHSSSNKLPAEKDLAFALSAVVVCSFFAYRSKIDSKIRVQLGLCLLTCKMATWGVLKFSDSPGNAQYINKLSTSSLSILWVRITACLLWKLKLWGIHNP